jgi:hypothetical protein
MIGGVHEQEQAIRGNQDEPRTRGAPETRSCRVPANGLLKFPTFWGNFTQVRASDVSLATVKMNYQEKPRRQQCEPLPDR